MIVGQLTDLHVGDHGSAEALERAVGAMLDVRPALDALLVTGDLTEHAADEEYAAVRDALARVPCPVHVLPGNHDARAPLRRHFGLPGEPDAPVHYAAEAGDVRLLVCDTTRPGHPDGRLNADQLAWLDGELEAHARTPAILALHHTPLTTGIAAMDALALDAGDRRALGAVLARHDQVLAVVGGHVHRSAVTTLGGRLVFACPSAYRQLRLDLATTAELAMNDEPAGAALHVVAGGELTSHLLVL